MKSSSRIALVGIIGGSLWLAACGHPGTAVTPKDIAVKDALGRPVVACTTDKPRAAQPIVVDLDDSTRTALDAAMSNGVVVVAYDCTTIKVLRNCKVGTEATKYEYGGVDPKEKVVSVTNSDELAVNVPMSSGKMGAEIKSGRNIDIAMITRGQQSAAFDNVLRSSLTGKDDTSCEGATHFIKQATIGAFAVVSGANGSVGAAAEVFNVGASGSSKADRKALSSDGSIDACKTAKEDGESPVKNCRAPLILELQPILAEAPKDTKRDPKSKDLPPPEAEASPCPAGWVFAQGKCTKAAQAAHTCDPSDEQECKAQCDKGSAESCFNHGAILYKKDRKSALPSFEKACEADNADACGYVADTASWELPIGTTDPKLLSKVEKAATKGCEGGSGLACESLGQYFHFRAEKTDLKKARRAYRRACVFGTPSGCGAAAETYARADAEAGVDADFVTAVEWGKRGCTDDLTTNECLELAKVYLDKRAGSARNEAKGMQILEAQCSKRSGDDCSISLTMFSLGEAQTAAPLLKIGEKYCAKSATVCSVPAMIYEYGSDEEGIAKNIPKAVSLYQKSCAVKDEMSCKKVTELKAAATPTKPVKTPPKKPTPKKK